MFQTYLTKQSQTSKQKEQNAPETFRRKAAHSIGTDRGLSCKLPIVRSSSSLGAQTYIDMTITRSDPNWGWQHIARASDICVNAGRKRVGRPHCRAGSRTSLATIPRQDAWKTASSCVACVQNGPTMKTERRRP